MSDFKFNISLSVLNHLGRNLYRNFITVIGEAISNSWDADAQNVWITIERENNFFVITDDGIGMSEDDFQNKFLRIRYSKRKNEGAKSPGGRPYIGNKGIGKLALLSCAKRISIYTKTKESGYIGGVIDNSGLDEAIKNDLSPDQYDLEPIDEKLLAPFLGDNDQGTVIYFEDLNEGISNRLEYIRMQIALSFRFSLVDPSFKIFVNEKQITEDDLNELAENTQFLWEINTHTDPYIEKLKQNPLLKREKKISSQMPIHGFIASVKKPSNLKIRGTNEKLSIDLFVNGRLREKNIMEHIPTARVVENYLYGQIFFDDLDSDEEDRFTSNREGVLADDPKYKELLEEINKMMNDHILDDWDEWRVELNQDGDPDNTRIKRKERKSMELFNVISEDFTPTPGTLNEDKVNSWIKELLEEAKFNFVSYGECFVSENLLRKVIKEKNIELSKDASKQVKKYKSRERENNLNADIAFEIRENNNDLLYLDMTDLAKEVDLFNPNGTEGQKIDRDVKRYKPIRNALSHTAILTKPAKGILNATYENIKAKIKILLEKQ
jgi:hypothetical protein